MTGRTIAFPFFNNLKEEQIGYMVEKLKEGIKLVVSKENAKYKERCILADGETVSSIEY